MQNLLILGSGRSGTSMVAGALAKAGYFMGERLLSPSPANPKGYFEDRGFNLLNEELLALVTPPHPSWWWRFRYGQRLGHLQGWLARLPLRLRFSLTPQLATQVQAFCAREPFCYKDPRLSYTLPAWRPFLRNTGFVCVFRSPQVTAQSMVQECQRDRLLQNLALTPQVGQRIWELMYRHILRHYRQTPNRQKSWLFLHYDQVLNGNGLVRLEEFAAAPVDRTFPDAQLVRSKAQETAPWRVRRLYRQLCALAACEPV